MSRYLVCCVKIADGCGVGTDFTPPPIVLLLII